MILRQFPLDFQWPTPEPFLFCAHHLDLYPRGDGSLSVEPKLRQGRLLGNDFTVRDGFRMYHGETVPGFPVHPHRGFETVTIVRQGLIDHADSMGAAGRYGEGDVQWMTAGDGVQHSEMFPLLRTDRENPVELFQIWLNLPAVDKRVRPDFKMLWSPQVPVVRLPEQKATLTVVAGEWLEHRPPAPPSASWASRKENETWIWLLQLEDGGSFEIPASRGQVSRALYFYSGQSARVGDTFWGGRTGAFLEGRAITRLEARGGPAKFLLLQSRPIGEPIVQHGPFVMNSREEIQQAFADYRSTSFGGWPWEREDMVHGPELRRFARYPDGRVEEPG